MTSLSSEVPVNTSKLKFSVESILGTKEIKAVAPEARVQEPPCAGCVAALYRCCRDEPMLQLPLPFPYNHLHPALRPTTGKLHELRDSLDRKASKIFCFFFRDFKVGPI